MNTLTIEKIEQARPVLKKAYQNATETIATRLVYGDYDVDLKVRYDGKYGIAVGREGLPGGTSFKTTSQRKVIEYLGRWFATNPDIAMAPRQAPAPAIKTKSAAEVVMHPCGLCGEEMPLASMKRPTRYLKDACCPECYAEAYEKEEPAPAPAPQPQCIAMEYGDDWQAWQSCGCKRCVGMVEAKRAHAKANGWEITSEGKLRRTSAGPQTPEPIPDSDLDAGELSEEYGEGELNSTTPTTPQTSLANLVAGLALEPVNLDSAPSKASPLDLNRAQGPQEITAAPKPAPAEEEEGPKTDPTSPQVQGPSELGNTNGRHLLLPVDELLRYFANHTCEACRVTISGYVEPTKTGGVAYQLHIAKEAQQAPKNRVAEPTKAPKPAPKPAPVAVQAQAPVVRRKAAKATNGDLKAWLLATIEANGGAMEVSPLVKLARAQKVGNLAEKSYNANYTRVMSTLQRAEKAGEVVEVFDYQRKAYKLA